MVLESMSRGWSSHRKKALPPLPYKKPGQEPWRSQATSAVKYQLVRIFPNQNQTEEEDLVKHNMTKLQYVVAFVSVLVVIHCNNVVRANPAVAASNNAALGKGELSRLLQQLLPKLRARMGHRAGLLTPPAALKANSVPPALVSSPEEVSFTDDEFEDLDQVDRFAAKRQSDDYGHWRYGKREFDDYGHMRFGR